MDQQVWKQCFRQNLAKFVVDGRPTGRHPVTTTIAAKRAEKCAVRWTGMHTVQTVDDV